MIKDLLDKVDNFFFGKKKVESKTTTNTNNTPIAYIEPNTKEKSKDNIISEQQSEIWRLRTEVQTLRDRISLMDGIINTHILESQYTPTGKLSLLQDPNKTPRYNEED